MSKAKVISVLNHKGGVGKTTTTINLGGALRQKGYKVLLIDLDGQANLTESLGFSAELPQTIYGAMKGEYDLPIYEHKDGLSVVPSCLDLSAVETELINEAGRELILAHLIKGQKEKFDYILIDCPPPSLSLLTLNALTASDRLIIPVQAQFLAMRGMAKLMQVVHKVQQRLNSDLSIAGVLITQYDGRNGTIRSKNDNGAIISSTTCSGWEKWHRGITRASQDAPTGSPC
jgi:chromosome partitioning protein